MIYLISDDSFFTLGAKAAFNAAHIDVTLIGVNIIKEALDNIIFTHKDIILLATEQADIITSFLTTARRYATKTLLVMDNASSNAVNSIQSVRSKKMPLNELLSLLEANVNYSQDLLFLTRQEVKIMRALTTGKTPYSLAKELNLSVKTICTHKINALKKLGLNHLNARSLLIFSGIYQGLSYF